MGIFDKNPANQTGPAVPLKPLQQLQLLEFFQSLKNPGL
jgi:hypothetical protein